MGLRAAPECESCSRVGLEQAATAYQTLLDRAELSTTSNESTPPTVILEIAWLLLSFSLPLIIVVGLIYWYARCRDCDGEFTVPKVKGFGLVFGLSRPRPEKNPSEFQIGIRAPPPSLMPVLVGTFIGQVVLCSPS